MGCFYLIFSAVGYAFPEKSETLSAPDPDTAFVMQIFYRYSPRVIWPACPPNGVMLGQRSPDGQSLPQKVDVSVRPCLWQKWRWHAAAFQTDIMQNCAVEARPSPLRPSYQQVFVSRLAEIRNWQWQDSFVQTARQPRLTAEHVPALARLHTGWPEYQVTTYHLLAIFGQVQTAYLHGLAAIIWRYCISI